MTSTPMEPEPDPEIVASGDPGMDPIDSDQEPEALVPEADPTDS